MSHVWAVVYTQVGSNNIGRIRRRVRVHEDNVDAQAINAGERVLACSFQPDQSTHYITNFFLNPQVTERPPAVATIDTTTVDADGADTVTVSGLTDGQDFVLVIGPNGRTAVPSSGGQVQLQFDTPGKYLVSALAFPRRRVTWTVTAA